MVSGDNRSRPGKPGRPRKPGKQQPFSLRLPADLHLKLKHYAVDHPGRSLNDVLVEVISDWWNKVPERRTYERLVEASLKKNNRKS